MYIGWIWRAAADSGHFQPATKDAPIFIDYWGWPKVVWKKLTLGSRRWMRQKDSIFDGIAEDEPYKDAGDNDAQQLYEDNMFDIMDFINDNLKKQQAETEYANYIEVPDYILNGFNNDYSGLTFTEQYHPYPQQVILPVQYDLNGINYGQNSDLYNNGNYMLSDESLAVLLPILLIGACLFGIICAICMGFGGLFCYREGKKSGDKNQKEYNAFYHKLTQKSSARNINQCRLSHYDEV